MLKKNIVLFLVICISVWLFFQPYEIAAVGFDYPAKSINQNIRENYKEIIERYSQGNIIDSSVLLLFSIVYILIAVLYPILFMLFARIRYYPLTTIQRIKFLITGFLVLVFVLFSFNFIDGQGWPGGPQPNLTPAFYIRHIYVALFGCLTVYFGFSDKESILSRVFFKAKPEN